ncbi:MAG: hypothetical protein HRT36_02610 [Alphaproteobacteria bacterium]|nr:hypothetical protein [Alphaproteobacteria bacterium]
MFIRIRLIPIAIVFVILMLMFRIGNVWNGIETAQIAEAIPNIPAVNDGVAGNLLLSSPTRTPSNSTGVQRPSMQLAQEQIDALSSFISEVRAQDTDAMPESGSDSGAPLTTSNTGLNASAFLVDFADIPLRNDPNVLGLTPVTLVDKQITDESIIDTNSLSVAEVRLLHTLADRRRQLDGRERGLTERESVLVAAEHQLIAQQQELETIRGEIRAGLATYNELQEKRIIQMRAVYSAMKPKKAALIFNELDLDVLINVLRGMMARKVAPIIAAMNVEKARSVTLSLADRDTYTIPE